MQPQITLAISLHSPNDELRRSIMPVANKYSIDEIMKACRYYVEKTGRRITFEYSLVKGIKCHVNLIPVNPIKERDYKQTAQAGISHFRSRLEKCGVNATVRREMGRDIDGACGQLRRSYMESTDSNADAPDGIKQE